MQISRRGLFGLAAVGALPVTAERDTRWTEEEALAEAAYYEGEYLEQFARGMEQPCPQVDASKESRIQ